MDAPDVTVAIETETEVVKLPPLGVIVGVATVAVTGALTVSENVVVFVMLPPVALTVMVEVPVGVALLVLIVSVAEQVGLQAVAEKDPLAPDGKPDTVNDTD